MASKKLFQNKIVAVLGAGKFGTAVANLVAPNVTNLLLYTHKAERALTSQVSRSSADQQLEDNVVVTNDLAMVLRSCSVIFPLVPAAQFRGLMQQIASDLRPDHILIHGTKGLDFTQDDDTVTKSCFATMSGVIIQETIVRQIGCLAGPNLSKDLVKKHPAITALASSSQKVLSVGTKLLSSNWFHVYTTSDLVSVEICSVLKNIFAIGAGIIAGMEYGSNTYAFFLTMSISEMRYIMTTMGIGRSALMGPAGLGDLIATCGSKASRNYTVGYRLAKGEKLSDILGAVKEVSEGIQTVKIIHQVMQSYGKKAPITSIIYRILFEQLPLQQALEYLMRY